MQVKFWKNIENYRSYGQKTTGLRTGAMMSWPVLRGLCDLSIVSSQFLKLFDKRDAFPFNMFGCRISLAIFLPQFSFPLTSELLRIAICSIGKNDFVHTAQILMVRMIKQGASNRMRLTRSLRRLFGNHSEHFMKFFESPELFILSILPNALPSNN